MPPLRAQWPEPFPLGSGTGAPGCSRSYGVGQPGDPGHTINRLDIVMPKKTITIPLTELRRDDVVKRTGLKLPKPYDPRDIFRVENQLYRPYEAQTEPAVEVERSVNERLMVRQIIREAGRIDLTIEHVVGEYLLKNGDPARLRITTQKEIGGLFADQIVVTLEGWTLS